MEILLGSFSLAFVFLQSHLVSQQQCLAWDDLSCFLFGRKREEELLQRRLLLTEVRFVFIATCSFNLKKLPC